MGRLDRPGAGALIDRIAAAGLRHPFAIVLALAACGAASLLAVPGLRIDTGPDPYVDRSGSLYLDKAAVDAKFVSDYDILIVYRAEDVFSHRALSAVRALGRDLEQIRVGDGTFAIEEVTSLTTVSDVVGSDLSFENTPLVPEDAVPTDVDELEQIRFRANKNPLIKDNLLGNTGQFAGLSARLSLELSPAERSAAIGQMRELLAGYSQREPGMAFYSSGAPVVDVDEADYLLSDFKTFIPISFAVIAALLFFFLRRRLSVALALVGSSLAIGVGIAMLPLLGGSLNSCNAMVAPVITAISAAIFIHYFSELSKRARPGDTPAQTVRRTLSTLFAPAWIAALTTACGFAANLVSDLPAVRHFGLALAVGVIAAFLFANGLFLVAGGSLPAGKLVSPAAVAASPRLLRLLDRFSEFHLRHRWFVLAASGATILAVLAGIRHIESGMDQLGNFHESAPVRQETRIVEEHLGGSALIIVSIEHPDRDHFTEPSSLARLDALDEFLRSPVVGADRVTSASDYVKLMHRGFFSDDDAEYRIPDTRLGVAQLLLLNGDDKLDEYLDHKQRWARVVAQVPAADSGVMADTYDALDSYLAANFPASAGYRAISTGRNKLHTMAMNGLEKTLISSFSLAILTITLVLFLLFRSASTVLYSLPVNVLPVLANLGLMGWLGIRLDAATVMISSICIGIAVDDSVHFLQHLRERLRRHGDLERGICETIRFKGPAILGTSVVLSVGFSVMLLSNFAMSQNFALLICSGITAALLGDLVLLPALLLCTGARLGVATSPVKRDAPAPIATLPGREAPESI